MRRLRKLHTIFGITALVLMTVLTGAFLIATRQARAHYADCKRELAAMAPKLRAYAQAHGGQLPTTEAELVSALGAPLPPRYLLYPMEKPSSNSKLQKKGYQYRAPYIIDDRPHPYYLPPLGYFPMKRIHMLLNDLTIYHAHSYNDFT